MQRTNKYNERGSSSQRPWLGCMRSVVSPFHRSMQEPSPIQFIEMLVNLLNKPTLIIVSLMKDHSMRLWVFSRSSLITMTPLCPFLCQIECKSSWQITTLLMYCLLGTKLAWVGVVRSPQTSLSLFAISLMIIMYTTLHMLIERNWVRLDGCSIFGMRTSSTSVIPEGSGSPIMTHFASAIIEGPVTSQIVGRKRYGTHQG